MAAARAHLHAAQEVRAQQRVQALHLCLVAQVRELCFKRLCRQVEGSLVWGGREHEAPWGDTIRSARGAAGTRRTSSGLQRNNGQAVGRRRQGSQ